MPGPWQRIFRAFRRPWKIKRRQGGGYWIESANGRVLLYVYPRHLNPDFKKPSDDEALDIVRAIARISKRRPRPPWVPPAKRPGRCRRRPKSSRSRQK